MEQSPMLLTHLVVMIMTLNHSVNTDTDKKVIDTRESEKTKPTTFESDGANQNTIVTVDDLAQAIRNSPSNRGMIEEEAYDLARHVLNFFGYSDRIIDNILEPEDRDAFYMLEDAAILTTEREETTLYDGREWRIHYWLFRKDRIRNLMECVNTYDEQDVSSNSAYNDLPSDIWDRSAK